MEAGLADLDNGGVLLNFYKDGQWDIYIPVGRNSAGQMVIRPPVACEDDNCLGVSTHSCEDGENIEICKCYADCQSCSTVSVEYETDGNPAVGEDVTQINPNPPSGSPAPTKEICSVNKIGGRIVSIKIS